MSKKLKEVSNPRNYLDNGVLGEHDLGREASVAGARGGGGERWLGQTGQEF